MKTYSFKIGAWKGIVSALTILLAVIVFAGLSDLTIWELMVQYVKPLLGSMTVGGLLTFGINWAKNRTRVSN